jgi:hypothetical protein
MKNGAVGVQQNESKVVLVGRRHARFSIQKFESAI